MAESPIIAVLAALAGRRFPLEDEKQTQAAMEAVLRHEFRGRMQREVRIMGGIIDFVVWPLDPAQLPRPPAGSAPAESVGANAIGIEVKIKGQPREILRQVRGYAWEPTLAGLILATAKPVPSDGELCGKPFVVLDLARAWL